MTEYILNVDSLDVGRTKINKRFSKTISANETDFFKKTSNLLFLNMMDTGKVITNIGVETYDSTYSTTNYISIKPNTTYVSNKFLYASLFDAEKKFKRRVQLDETNLFKFDSAEDEFFIRISIQNSRLVDAQFVEGTVVPSSYEKGNIKIDSKLIEDTQTAMLSTATNCSFFTKSSNLLSLQDLEEKTVVDINGNVVSNAVYNLTGFISVKPNTSYMANAQMYIAIYDKHLNFTRRIQPNTSAVDLEQLVSFVTFEDEFYIRIMVHSNRYDYSMVIEGEKAIPYESGNIYIKDEYIKKTTKTFQNYIPSISFASSYTNTNEYGDMKPMIADSSSKLQDIYALYDDLVSRYPNYVSKTSLGMDSSGIYPIYRYDFRPNKQYLQEFEYPKAIVTAGTHGAELAAIWNTAYMMKNICDDWKQNEALELLRYNVNFIVIPVVNPYSVVNGTRNNSNDIDIARNFPSGHMGGANNSGTPLSEKEAQYINKVMLENKDAFLCVDFHNFFTHTQSEYYFLWAACSNNTTLRVSSSVINHMNSKWIKEYNFFDDNQVIGYTDMTSPGGSIGTQANAYGIPIAGTFEASNRLHAEVAVDPPRYSSNVIKLGVEAFVNFIVKSFYQAVETNN